MTDVLMPQMGESIVEGTLTKWLKKAGERVERDEPLFEISTDKVDTEIPSPAAGTLAEVLVEEGKTVGINTVVARIEESGGSGENTGDKITGATTGLRTVRTPRAPVGPASARRSFETDLAKWLSRSFRKSAIARQSPCWRGLRARSAEPCAGGR